MRESRLSKVYLCSFASPDLKLSVNRFIKQSHELKFYDEVKVFGWKDLSLEKKNKYNLSLIKVKRDFMVMAVGRLK